MAMGLAEPLEEPSADLLYSWNVRHVFSPECMDHFCILPTASSLMTLFREPSSICTNLSRLAVKWTAHITKVGGEDYLLVSDQMQSALMS